MKKDIYLTTNQGDKVSDNQNSLTVGERGPVVLQDVHFSEKLAHFDCDRMMSNLTKADPELGRSIAEGLKL